MVDYRWDTTVGIVFGVFGSLVLALVESEVDGLVGQAKLFEDESDLPTIKGGTVSNLFVFVRIATRTIRLDRLCGRRE